jgi:methyl-accepting chemotaxis protein
MQQSSGASEQAEVIRLTNKLLDDFLRLSENIKQQAHNVNLTAQQTANISQQGQAALTQAIAVMDEIRQRVSEIGETIVVLAKLTRRVDEIITSVSEIATQSNLLAMNASIEAARAGMHGRGFAVVADEVRMLSQQSTQAAGQVRAILVEIQQAMKRTVEATRVGMHGVDAGVSQTREANAVMVQLAGSVTESHEAVSAIYDVIRQQTEGLEEIAISMDRINRITQQNLASTRTVEMVSTNLTRLAAELQATVDSSSGLERKQFGG